MSVVGGLVNRILSFRPVARALLKPVLNLHSRTYHWAGILAIAADGDGRHPKHRILQYKEWFLENIRPEWTVADIGCHEGMMAYALARKADFVYGIEILEERVAYARKHRSRGNLEYLCADATKVDLGTRKVDCLTLSNVLEHIERRVDFLKGLLENPIWKNPAEKILLIRVPMIDREWVAPFKKELGLNYRLDPTHYIEYTLGEFLDEMARSGIEVCRYEIKFGEIYAVCRAKR